MNTTNASSKNLRTIGLSLVLALAAFLPNRLRADVYWGNWQPIGYNVSVSVALVPGTSTWTWKFRNDGVFTITYLDFNYTDSTGTHYDVLPVPLAQGQAFGGWGSFTSSSYPIIQIKTIQTR
jgi:hypothetical protein